jgi:hypothetical protein
MTIYDAIGEARKNESADNSMTLKVTYSEKKEYRQFIKNNKLAGDSPFLREAADFLVKFHLMKKKLERHIDLFYQLTDMDDEKLRRYGKALIAHVKNLP